MTDRLAPGDGSPACPFIAFEDERDERSSSPDHRHRCYAEVQPAPRALAHQEAYCLSSAFPVCPTFQDWARREAAHARAGGRSASGPGAGASIVGARGEGAAPRGESGGAGGPTGPTGARGDSVSGERGVGTSDAAAARPAWDGSDAGGAEGHDRGVAPTDADPDRSRADDDEDAGEDPWSGMRPDADPVILRNPPRDWAAPPPWATGAGGSASGGGRGAPDDRAPGFLASRDAGRGLAGSAADRLASGLPPTSAGASAGAGVGTIGSDDLAGLVSPGRTTGAASPPPPISRPPSGHYPTTSAAGRRPTVSSTRDRSHPPEHDGPSWERARRYEAFPTIKTRVGLPGVPRLALWGGALAIAALALFFLPQILGIGGGATPSASVSPTATATSSGSSAAPTDTPLPTSSQLTYTIKKGDNLTKIAKKFGVTQAQILTANPTIKDANKIAVGDVIVIPSPAPSDIVDPSAKTPKPSASSP